MLLATLTVFWLGSKLLHRFHAVQLQALRVTRRADLPVIHIDDVLELMDLRKNILGDKETKRGTVTESSIQLFCPLKRQTTIATPLLAPSHHV